MKVIITVKRLVEYSTIVEMDEKIFQNHERELAGGRVESQKSEKELNRLIDVKDWQDDDFHSLESFEKLEAA